jgi:hypothetical protein
MKTILAVIALAVFISAPALAADLIKCKKADGSLYVGPTPPENCVATGTFAATKQHSSNPLEAARERRDEIEDELEKQAHNAEVLGSMTSTAGSLADTTHDLAYHANSPGIARTGDRIEKIVVDGRRETLYKIRGLYDEWSGLKTKASALNGGTPPGWWHDEVRCRDCPSRADIDAKLAAESR